MDRRSVSRMSKNTSKTSVSRSVGPKTPKTGEVEKATLHHYDAEIDKKEAMVDYSHPLMTSLLGSDFSKFRPLDRFEKYLLRSLAAPTAQLILHLELDPKSKQKVVENFFSSSLFLLSLDRDSDLAVSFIKFHVQTWFQKANCDDLKLNDAVPNKLPEFIQGRKLFPGLLHQLIKRLIARSRDGNVASLAIISSFHLFKLGLDKLSPFHVLETVRTHQESYSSTPPPLSAEADRVIRSTVQSCIERIPKTLLTKMSPSGSACAELSRSKGGTLTAIVAESSRQRLKGILREYLIHDTHFDPDPITNSTPLEDFENRVLSSSIRKVEEKFKKPQNPKEFRIFWKLLQKELSRPENRYPSDLLVEVKGDARGLLPGIISAALKLKKSYFETLQRWSEKKYGSVLRAAVHIIEEPAKERVITAGSASLTYLQPIQGFLLSAWKATEYHTMDPNWFDRLSSDLMIDYDPDWVNVSGDYDAATDKLHITCTSAAWDQIQKFLDIDVWSGLLPEQTRLVYPIKALKQLSEDPKFRLQLSELKDSVLQTNGQLMGHPLSFPLLCFINLAGVELTFERLELDEETRKRIRTSLRINGDDIFFRCPKFVYSEWKETVNLVGFLLSKGKSYASKNFGMINNVFFRTNSVRVARFGFLNQRLMFNHALKKEESEESPIWIGRAFTEMFSLAPRSSDFLIDCVSNRQKGFKIKGFVPNFFIPCRLGGLGVDPKFARNRVGKGIVRFTRDQRCFAALCSERQELGALFSSGSFSSQDVLIAEILNKFPKLSNVINSISQYPERVQLSNNLMNNLPFAEKLQYVPVEVEANYKNWVGVLTSLQLENLGMDYLWDVQEGCAFGELRKLNDLFSKFLKNVPPPINSSGWTVGRRFFQVKSGFDRRLNVKFLRDVQPMNKKKLMRYSQGFDLEDLSITYPVLPPVPQPFVAIYPVASKQRLEILDELPFSQSRTHQEEEVPLYRRFVGSYLDSYQGGTDLLPGDFQFFLPALGTKWADEVEDDEDFFKPPPQQPPPSQFKSRRLESLSPPKTGIWKSSGILRR